MKVVLVGPVPPPHQGMTVYTQMLLDELGALDVPVHWIDSSDHRGLSNIGRVDWDNVSGAMKTAVAILGSARLRGPRLLYLPIAQSRLPFVRDALHLILGRVIGANEVVHLHGSAFADFYRAESPLMRWLIRSTLDRCSSIVVLTASLASQFDGITSRPDIVVVPNAIAAVVDPGTIEGRYASMSRRRMRIGFLSRISPAKGAADFARAVERLPAHVASEASFVIAGNRSDQFADEYAEMCKIFGKLAEAGVDTEIAGALEGAEKTAFFANTDVFVLPSYDEGQPLAVIEALSAGCAVVATNVGGLPETVQHGEEALLVPPGDIEGLSSVIRGLVQEPDTVVALGRMGRRRWEQCYQPHVNGKAMADVFASVLNGPGR